LGGLGGGVPATGGHKAHPYHDNSQRVVF